MRRLAFGTLFVFVAALFAAPVFAGTILKFSSIHEPSHPSAFTAEFFAERVKQMTKGEVEIQVYHSRQLGDARDNVENVRNGSIAFTSVSISNLSQVLPVMDAWSLPFIFKSDDHYWYVLNDPKAMEFMKQLEPKGMKTLTWITSGARNFFTQKPIRTPADMKGMKIRVMASPVMINTMKAMGASGVPTAWVKSDLLLSHTIHILGANGLAFDRNETGLFVGNTGDHTIVRVPVVNGAAGKPEIFIRGVNGPDGMFVDEDDRLWVVANQSDEILVFDKTGKVLSKLGDFNGLDDNGAPRGLLFPAGMEKIGDSLYVLNLVVDGRYFKGLAQTVISQWAGEVKVYNIVRIPIPPFLK